MYSRPLVPKSFNVPKIYSSEEFILKPLTVSNVIKDYDAVMSSVEHLTGLMDTDDKWPVGLTIEENLIDLGWHQREFTLRHSFAYSVMSPKNDECLGCCYIYPSDKLNFEAQAFYWIRQSRLADGLQERLGKIFEEWLHSVWPFNKIDFPQNK